MEREVDEMVKEEVFFMVEVIKWDVVIFVIFLIEVNVKCFNVLSKNIDYFIDFIVEVFGI